MSGKPKPAGLVGLDFAGQVSAKNGSPYVMLSAVGIDGQVLHGRISPDEARQVATGLLYAAFASETEAGVFAELVEGGIEPARVAYFIGLLRARAERQRPAGPVEVRDHDD